MPEGAVLMTSLRAAVASLRLALAQDYNDFIRDATIQRFEYTYELAWKFLQRFLSSEYGQGVVAGWTRKELFRAAAKKGWIDDVEHWLQFHQARNLTSHVYDEQIADQVYQAAQAFADAAERLCQHLERVNAAS